MQLPRELITSVVTYAQAPTLRRVCKELSYEFDATVESLVIPTRPYLLSARSAAKFFRRLTKLKKLSIYVSLNNTWIDVVFMQAIARIPIEDLTMWSLTSHQLLTISRCCSQLKKLSFNPVESLTTPMNMWPYNELLELELRECGTHLSSLSILVRLSQLTSLQCTSINFPRAQTGLSSGPERLLKLSLSECSIHPSWLQSTIPSLTELDIGDLVVGQVIDTSDLLIGFPSLQSLKSMQYISGDINKLSMLKSLHLSVVSATSPIMLTVLQQLTSLFIQQSWPYESGHPDTILTAFSSTLTTLQHLQLYGSYHYFANYYSFSDTTTYGLLNAFTGNNNIKILTLGLLYDSINCTTVSALMKEMPGLAKLHLDKCCLKEEMDDFMALERPTRVELMIQCHDTHDDDAW